MSASAGPYACLLFAVNVGRRRVPARELRDAAARAGFADISTVANSGNLVLRPGLEATSGPAATAARVHDLVLAEFGVEALIAVLTGHQLTTAIEANPFAAQASQNPAHVQLLVGTGAVDDAGVAALAARHPGPERISSAHGMVYVSYPDGIGRSSLTQRMLTRACGREITGRNWNTVEALSRLTNPPPPAP